tara:strand:- start:5928 stop:6146 length:219 start_codon:yes stop_codon:yes gene_type:complete
MENNSNIGTLAESPKIYTAEEICLIIGAIGALIASFVYALKNVNHLRSGCCECDQKVDEEAVKTATNLITEV